MSTVQIVYADPRWLGSYYQTLDSVALERIYVEMIEALEFEKTRISVEIDRESLAKLLCHR